MDLRGWRSFETKAAPLLGYGGLIPEKRAEVLGDRLLYPAREDEDNRDHKALGANVLLDFAKLDLLSAEAFPKGVQAFARKWGVLGVCAEHGRSRFHDIECPPRQMEHESKTVYWEPLQIWREYAHHVAMIHDVGRHLFGETRLPALLAAWLAESTKDGKLPASIADRRRLLENPLAYLAYAAVPYLGIDWGRGSPEPGWAFGGVLGAVYVELLKLVTSEKRFEMCSRCGDMYEVKPTRRIFSNRNHYCRDCGEQRVQNRRRQVKVRETKRDVKQWFAQGVPAPVIAEKLARPLPTIERWIAEPRRPGPSQRKRAAQGTPPTPRSEHAIGSRPR